MTLLIAVVAVGLGLAFVVVGALLRSRDRERELRALLDLPWGEEDLTREDIERVSLFEPGVDALDHALARFDLIDRLRASLERARVPLRPGELVLLVAIGAVLSAMWAWSATGQPLFGALGASAAPVIATLVLRRRTTKRRRAFEEQLPDALSLIASSLQAGHSLLHAIEMMTGEADPPLADEFERVLAETLFTLSDYLRQRQEFHREVRVMTAEGKLSAVVLAALPACVFLALQATNPDYISELYRAPGLFLLVGAVVSVVIGIAVILRMIRVEL